MKLVLTVIVSGEAFERIELSNFTTVRIGRAENCAVKLDNDAVSSAHCEIVRTGKLLRLYDLDSQNGTRLNDTPIQEHALTHGDTIGIGKFTLDVAITGLARSSQRRERAPIGEMTLDGDREVLGQAQRDAETRLRAYMTFDDDRRDTLILDGHTLRFGRDSEAEVSLKGLLTPRLAAIIVRDELGFRLIDLSPRGNSVLVNDTRASDVRLCTNDRVRVRGLSMTFFRGRPSSL